MRRTILEEGGELWITPWGKKSYEGKIILERGCSEPGTKTPWTFFSLINCIEYT